MFSSHCSITSQVVLAAHFSNAERGCVKVSVGSVNVACAEVLIAHLSYEIFLSIKFK